MLNPLLPVWLGATANLLAGVHYTYSTVRAPSDGGTQPKPNPVSWGIWSLSGWLALLGQISEGVRNEALLTSCVAAVPTFIFVASIIGRRRYGAYAPVSHLDILCGGLAVLTLVAWRLTASGSVAVALSIVCDALVGVPVVRQAYRDPGSDSPSIWVAGAVNAIITLTIFRSFTFLAAGFGLYFLGLCLLVSFLLVVRPRLQRIAQIQHTIRTARDPTVNAEDLRESAAAFAGAFVADYLTWDEADPHRRGKALTRYIHGDADPLWGWSGIGRQRVDRVLLGLVERAAAGYFVVDVHVRVTTASDPRPPVVVADSGTTLARAVTNGETALGEEAVLEIPVPGRSLRSANSGGQLRSDSQCFRLHVPVTVQAGQFCIPT